MIYFSGYPARYFPGPAGFRVEGGVAGCAPGAGVAGAGALDGVGAELSAGSICFSCGYSSDMLRKTASATVVSICWPAVRVC